MLFVSYCFFPPRFPLNAYLVMNQIRYALWDLSSAIPIESSQKEVVYDFIQES